jgi:two-component system copper resistance phosphate regulon response regulator CusR
MNARSLYYSGVRVLLVEDEPRLADATARGLREHAHAVDVAGSLAAARTKLALESYDVILLDVGLPDGSGLDLLAGLRAEADVTPVLILTARDALEDRVAGLDGGADDYLVKPFALEELLARLRAIARRPARVRPTTLTVDTLRLDPVSKQGWRGERPLELTTTEFALLHFLGEHVGEVCSRALIAGKVWDENYDPLSNIIDVYIARLRRKVDGEDDRPLLHTVRGSGYVLAPDGRSG